MLAQSIDLLPLLKATALMIKCGGASTSRRALDEGPPHRDESAVEAVDVAAVHEHDVAGAAFKR